MGKRLGQAVALGTLLVSVGAWPAEGPAITVRVYDRAGIPEAALEQAKEETGRILRKTGVETHWVNCPAKGQRDPACDTEVAPAEARLRILPLQGPSKTGQVLGAALALGEGRFGNLATVFYGGVDEMAGGERLLARRLLGYAIAHELGHLLLGPGSHSESGIMMAQWKEKALKGAPKASFLFTRREAERVRDAVTARMLAAQARIPVVTAAAP